MKDNKDLPTEPPSTSDKVFDTVSNTYNWWNRLASLNPKDPILVTLLKVGVRIIGILVLIAISPLALLGLIISFFAVI